MATLVLLGSQLLKTEVTNVKKLKPGRKFRVRNKQDLCRMVTEGGHLNGWKFAARQARRRDRRETRQTLQLAVHDEVVADTLPKRWTRDDLWSSSKCGCRRHMVRTWLETQVGRPWDSVRGKIARQYGSNSFRHTQLRGHIFDYIGESASDVNRHHRFRVDVHGILQHGHDFDYGDIYWRTFPTAPASWPPHQKTDAPEPPPYSNNKLWALVNIAGEPHWVCAVAWCKDVDLEGKVSYYPTHFRYVRPSTQEETGYLRTLPMKSYRRWFLHFMQRSRKLWNRSRVREERTSLPELVLVD